MPASPNVDFVLSNFESDVTMSLSGTVASSSIPSITADATAEIDISLSALKSVFKYSSDSEDVTDLSANDIKYYVESASFPSLNPANATVKAADAIATSGIAANKQYVAHDFVRHIASELFNTYHGVDLFNNEVALLNNIRSICGSESGKLWDTLKGKLAKVGVAGDHADLVKTGEKFYLTNGNATDENFTRVLMEQMMGVDVERFATLETADANGLRSLPFKSGDSISFKLTINPDASQKDLTGVAEVKSRSYQIKLNISESPSTPEVAADESA
jgi:hypothetical protein